MIVEKDILTEEAIENCTVPVVVDLEMAKVETNEVSTVLRVDPNWLMTVIALE